LFGGWFNRSRTGGRHDCRFKIIHVLNPRRIDNCILGLWTAPVHLKVVFLARAVIRPRGVVWCPLEPLQLVVHRSRLVPEPLNRRPSARAR